MASMQGRSRVIVAGGGVAALEGALALQALADDFVSVEVVAPDRDFTYRPLAVAEPFRVAQMRRFPLRRLVEAAGAELRTGVAVAVDPDQKQIRLADGAELSYDALLLALGARPREAVPGAITFRGAEDVPALSELLDRVVAGEAHRIVFAVPPAVSWPLPLYELALMTAEFAVDRGSRGVEVVVATPEDDPLGLFGAHASEAIVELLEVRGIRVYKGVAPLRAGPEGLQLAGGHELEADADVALAGLEGPRLEGVPSDGGGFVPTDELGWVLGPVDVYAAGDMTQFPVKQGGLATQQADAAASAIASDAGAPVRPTTFKPVLRGLLLTGLSPRYVRATTSPVRTDVSMEPLWWPPAKIVGRYLAPFLAEHLGLSSEVPPAVREAGTPVEVALDPAGRRTWAPI
jgi:sulfide:quinone oxidoreductase